MKRTVGITSGKLCKKSLPEVIVLWEKIPETVTGSFRRVFLPTSGTRPRCTYVAVFFMKRLRKWDGPKVGRYPK